MDTKINLCDNCIYCIADCNGQITFGDGIGDDNVIECDQHTVKQQD